MVPARGLLTVAAALTLFAEHGVCSEMKPDVLAPELPCDEGYAALVAQIEKLPDVETATHHDEDGDSIEYVAPKASDEIVRFIAVPPGNGGTGSIVRMFEAKPAGDVPVWTDGCGFGSPLIFEIQPGYMMSQKSWGRRMGIDMNGFDPDKEGARQ